MSEDTMTRDDLMDGLMDDISTIDPDTRPTLKAGVDVCKIVKIEKKNGDVKLGDSGAMTGWTTLEVEFIVANGTMAGKARLWNSYNIGAPKDAEGKLVPSPEKVAEQMAKGKTEAEAVDIVNQKTLKAIEIGKEGLAKLINAAGFINEAQDKDGKGAKRIAAGLAEPFIKETFTWDALKDRYVMVKHVDDTYNGKTKQKVTSVWDVDPAKVGDTTESVPF